MVEHSHHHVGPERQQWKVERERRGAVLCDHRLRRAVDEQVLADIQVNGQPRKVMIQANKNGFLYTLDRTNCKLIAAHPITRVNWASKIDLATGRPVLTDIFKRFVAGEEVEILPSRGTNATPIAFNPNNGLIYASTWDVPRIQKLAAPRPVPMGGVFVRKHVYDGLMNGPENAIDLFHGYTYSAHPLACAAALAVLDIYKNEGLFQRAADLSKYWEDGVHSLKSAPGVTDVRNLGLAAGIDFEGRKDAPGARGYDTFVKAFELGLMVRQSGDCIAMSPPLVIEKAQIDEIIDLAGKAIKEAA